MRGFLLGLLFLSSLLYAPPKAVIFDYGGVVANVDRKPVLLFLSQSLNKDYKRIKKKFSGEKLYKAFNQPPAFWEQFASKPLPDSWFADLEKYKKQMVQETPGMRELIDEIKGQGIQVALLSNTNVYRARFIDSMGGYDQFDPALLSCYLGVRKPDPKIYHKLLQSLIWEGKECVFVDNQLTNVEAARAFQIDGILFTSVDQLKIDLEKRGIHFHSEGSIDIKDTSYVYP
jgi:HAD superfamily hydrolase (TIGR01509 family)